jgi:PIN domain nuclease of toxin-antitoxin system
MTNGTSRFLGEQVLIILDTHIFIWLTEQLLERIPAKIQTALDAEPVLGIAAISLWEVAMLEEKERITLSIPVLPWLRKALAAPKIKLLPITPEVAARSGRLSMH